MRNLFTSVNQNSIVRKLFSIFILLSVVFLAHTSISGPMVKAQDDMEILISNDQFVLHPTKYDWDIQDFLDRQPGILKNYQFQTADGLSTPKEEIEFFAFLYSINPQIILAILEVQDQLLSNPNPTEESIISRNIIDEGGTFSDRIRRITEALHSGYYSSLNEGFGELSATRSVLAVLTKEVKPKNWSKDDWELGYDFQSTFGLYFDDPLKTFEDEIAVSETPTFQLPWAAGEYWAYWQGPHAGDFSGCVPDDCLFTQDVVNAALDFVPQNSVKATDKYACGSNDGVVDTAWIVSIASGEVIYANKSLVVVRHADGWFSQYYHVAAQERVTKNTQLNGIPSSGRRIGHPSNSCELGGYSDKSHVHFLAGRDGQYVPATQLILSGWSVYPNKLVKDQTEVQLRNYLESTNPFVPIDSTKRTTKWIYISIPWWYTLYTGDGGDFKVFYNGDEIFSYSGASACVTGSATKWFGRGWHLIEIEYSGNQRPSIDKVFWPNTIACGYVPPDPPPSDPQPTPGSTPPPPATTDSATFLTDLTLPDGSAVSPGQALVKTWRVRNSGSATWSGYKLKFTGGEQMGGPAEIAIPTTAPGATVDLSLNLTAPTTPGAHSGTWRIVKPDGTWVSGGQLWVKINVQTSSSDITLSADPSSPASTDQVNIRARVNNFPNLRAMRVLVDGNPICELGAPEITNCAWAANGYAAGQHTIVVEVDDWSGPSWDNPQRQSLVYELTGGGAANHAPNRPAPTSPYDWYVYYSGNTAQLCAQANGDPDGDAISGYYFDIFDSAQLWNSGWAGSSCVTTAALGPYDYQWRVKVRDSQGAESEWSYSRHFTLVNPSLSISELYFEPQDGNSEQVKIRACTTGQGGIGITMRVSVNDANDGSDSGEWHIIKELGVPCFNATDAPIWNTLDYGDGPHRVRVEAHGLQTGWNGAAVREETYTLPHRRPASPRLVAPVPLSGGAIYLNSRTVTFRWESALRANSYTLHVSANPSPKDDSNPVFRQTFGSSTTQHTVTFGQDYAALYWQVTATNDAGANDSGAQPFGIDRAGPSCSVQPLAAVTYESVFQVNWSGSDNPAGIRAFDVQFLDSGRDVWRDWLTGVPAGKTYELFAGQPGHTYSFRCRATDNAGNSGDYPANADTSTKVDPTARPPTPWWNSAYSGKRNLTILNLHFAH